MRRLWIILMAVALTVTVGLPAGAAPPKCDEDPTLPGCGGIVDDEPKQGTTCAYVGKWSGEPVTDDFDITLRGKSANACVDVMSIEGSWTVNIDIMTGTVRSLLLVPRDSIGPGDSCGGFSFRRDIPSTVVLPGPDHPSDLDGDEQIEGAYVNSCGIQFGEWVGDDHYVTVDTGIPSPLAFQIAMTGSSDAEVILHVELP